MHHRRFRYFPIGFEKLKFNFDRVFAEEIGRTFFIPRTNKLKAIEFSFQGNAMELLAWPLKGTNGVNERMNLLIMTGRGPLAMPFWFWIGPNGWRTRSTWPKTNLATESSSTTASLILAQKKKKEKLSFDMSCGVS